MHTSSFTFFLKILHTQIICLSVRSCFIVVLFDRHRTGSVLVCKPVLFENHRTKHHEAKQHILTKVWSVLRFFIIIIFFWFSLDFWSKCSELGSRTRTKTVLCSSISNMWPSVQKQKMFTSPSYITKKNSKSSVPFPFWLGKKWLKYIIIYQNSCQLIMKTRLL